MGRSVEGAPGKHRLAIANAEGQVTVHSWDDEKVNSVSQATLYFG